MEKELTCKKCNGEGNVTVMQGNEAIDYIDCICTDDRWNPNNQDICLECSGKGCEWCDHSGKCDD